MRVAALFLIGAASTALASDARVTLLAKQLANTKDPRVRAQTVLLLGQTQSDEAVASLCKALTDPESIVRAAAATALGELRSASGMACLKGTTGEPDASVRSAVERALAFPPIKPGGLYVNVEPTADKGLGIDSALLALAHGLLKQNLETLGATIAPPGEEKRAASALIKGRGLRGYQVRLQLGPGATEKQMKVEMLIMTYPEQSLQGSWNVKASGGKPEALIKAMVPKVVDDAAGDLNWKVQ